MERHIPLNRYINYNKKTKTWVNKQQQHLYKPTTPETTGNEIAEIPDKDFRTFPLKNDHGHTEELNRWMKWGSQFSIQTMLAKWMERSEI